MSSVFLTRRSFCSLQERIGHVKQHRTVNLNLDGCSRHFLAPDILDLDFLVTLSLCDNELQLLPPQIGSLKKLRRLLLSNNCFAEVPEVLRYLLVSAQSRRF